MLCLSSRIDALERKLESVSSVLLTILFVGTFWLTSQCLAADGPRPVYVVSDWRSYLQMVSVSTHSGCTPLLYVNDTSGNAKVRHFVKLYDGTAVTADSVTIDSIIAANWPHPETVVTCEDDRRLGLVASVIASALESPLLFPPQFKNSPLPRRAKRIIAVGKCEPVEGVETKILSGLTEALQYYNGLVETEPGAILIADDEFSFLASSVAAGHRASIVTDYDEIIKHRPRYLAWVTEPKGVTVDAVKGLYQACMFTPGLQVYEPAIGVLTALSAGDLSLLIARTQVYPQLQGDWKSRIMVAGVGGGDQQETWRCGPMEFTSLRGADVSVRNFTDALQSVGYAELGAHGSPGGFQLADDSWPSDKEVPPLPPLVFIGESCLTGDITGAGVEKSVALRLIAAGAVAYVGSMEIGGVATIGDYPFAFCSPQAPLGEHVRLQSAGRVDLHDDWPHAVLIGDPTFHQLEHERIEYTVDTASIPIRVMIEGPSDSISTAVVLRIPGCSDIEYAESVIDGEECRYGRGGLIWGKSVAVAPAFDLQTMLIEWPGGGGGEVTVFSESPLLTAGERILVKALVGIQSVFWDMPTIMPGFSWGVAGASIVLLLVLYLRGFGQPRSRFWIGLISGIGIALALCWTGYGLWYVMIAAACVNVAVVWLAHAEIPGLKRPALATLYYLVPLSLVLLLVLGLSPSLSLPATAALGVILFAVAHFLILLLVRWLYRLAVLLASRLK
jgi:hypothetical protein